MTIDYGSMLRNHSIETHWPLCLKPSLVWDRNIIARSEAPDVEAIEILEEQIEEATVVLVLRALTEDESWALDIRYPGVTLGTPEARALDKSVLLMGFVRWETLDGDLIDALDRDALSAYWDTASPGEKVPLLALTQELKAFVPAVPFLRPQSPKTRP